MRLRRRQADRASNATSTARSRSSPAPRVGSAAPAPSRSPSAGAAVRRLRPSSTPRTRPRRWNEARAPRPWRSSSTSPTAPPCAPPSTRPRARSAARCAQRPRDLAVTPLDDLAEAAGTEGLQRRPTIYLGLKYQIPRLLARAARGQHRVDLVQQGSGRASRLRREQARRRRLTRTAAIDYGAGDPRRRRRPGPIRTAMTAAVPDEAMAPVISRTTLGRRRGAGSRPGRRLALLPRRRLRRRRHAARRQRLPRRLILRDA